MSNQACKDFKTKYKSDSRERWFRGINIRRAGWAVDACYYSQKCEPKKGYNLQFFSKLDELGYEEAKKFINTGFEIEMYPDTIILGWVEDKMRKEYERNPNKEFLLELAKKIRGKIDCTPEEYVDRVIEQQKGNITR